MKKITKCPNCGSQDFTVVETRSDGSFEFSVARCLACSLYFQNPLPSKEFLKDFYSKLYKKTFSFRSTETAFENENKIQEIKRLLAIQSFCKGGKILDVGASSGHFLIEVGKHPQWEGYGVDISDEAVKKAKKRGLNIIQGELTTSPFSDGYFDVITMHSVLEHIPDLHETIDEVWKKLKTGGIFVFNVPSIGSFEYFFYRTMRKSFPGFIFEHLYYFTPGVLRSLMKFHRFSILEMTSRHYSTLSHPPIRPISGLITFVPKLFLEYTDTGGKLKLGNVLYVYAKKDR